MHREPLAKLVRETAFPDSTWRMATATLIALLCGQVGVVAATAWVLKLVA